MLHGTLGTSAAEVAAAGQRIVAAAPAIAHAAPLIGALVEPWETIPLGARVIAAADAFDTLGDLAELRRSPAPAPTSLPPAGGSSPRPPPSPTPHP